MVFAVENVIDSNPYNYRYAASKTLTLAEIFLEKSDLHQVKFHADKARDFMERDRIHNKEIKIVDMEQLGLYYNVMSRYCRMSGNAAHAWLYADSAAAAHSKYEEDFNLRKLLYAEQHIKQQELDAEILRSKTYFRNMIMISVFAFAFLVFMTCYIFLYRQKRTAYRALVIKTQQWAEVPFVHSDDTQDKEDTSINANDDDKTEREKSEPDELDRQLFSKLNKLIMDKQLHLNPETTLDNAAQLLKVSRAYLSQAVNRCTGGNFTSCINEYRVKEAVRLISDTTNKNISIERIAVKAGFNDRITFYRVFKKITGFSPADFRSQLISIRK